MAELLVVVVDGADAETASGHEVVPRRHSERSAWKTIYVPREGGIEEREILSIEDGVSEFLK